MGKGGTGVQPVRRLLVRLAFVCLAPLAAIYWNLAAGPLGFVAGSTVFWSALEAGIFFKVKACHFCKNFPFILRLLCGFGLDLQMAWLMGPEASEAGPALGDGYGSLMDNITSQVVAASAKRRQGADGVHADGGLASGAGRAAGGEDGLLSDPVPTYVATLSVVLPCANEGDFVKKTIMSVFDATPSEELKEIIIIDDASQPAVADLITEEELSAHRARVIRHKEQEGLIRSKKDGGDAARGDAVVFLDCHVKPMDGWTKPILRNLRENPRRIVVPAITALNPDTWQEISPYGGGTKMCLTWDADFFWCNDYPGPFVPIMSGGLLAMTKFWWESIGGYDSEMRAWGGENLDQSLRTWLCGGEIRVAEGSRVAHMWRDPNNKKTQLHYRIPTNDVRRNRLRAAAAWFDGWADKVRTFPQFEDFREGGPLHVGSLDSFEYYRKKLKCKGFVHYLNKFKDFYLDTGRIPDSVFNLREKTTGLCMSHQLAQGKSKAFVLTACSRGSELQRFHEANVGPSRRCCSGIKAWDFEACLTAWSLDAELSTSSCESFGRSNGQWFRLTSEGVLEWQKGSGCVVPKEHSPAEARQGPRRPAVFSRETCSAHFEQLDGPRIRVRAGGLCLAVGPGESLVFVACTSASDKEQVFTSSATAGGAELQLRAESGSLCVENVGGMPEAHACRSDPAPDQLFSGANLSGPVVSASSSGDRLHLCAAPAPLQAVQFAECATSEGGQKAKLGQNFAKTAEQADGSFMLWDEDLGTCLKPQRQGQMSVLVTAECPAEKGEAQWRWRHDEHGGQLRSVALDLCLDANDFRTLILYPCYQPGTNVKQRYALRSNGWVEMPRSWADNGRLRYPAQCLDSFPVPPSELQVVNCRKARSRGISWERAWPEVPLETQLWRKATAGKEFLGRFQ